MNKFIELLQRNVLIELLMAMVLLIAGFAMGLGAGWMTVDFKPSADDVSAAADAYATNNDAAFARRFLKNLSNEELTRLLNDLYRARSASNRPLEAERIKKLGEALGVNVSGSAPGVTPAGAGTLLPPATRAAGTPAPTTTPPAAQAGGINWLFAILGVLLCLFLVAAAAAVILYFKALPNLRKPRPARATTLPSMSSPASTLDTDLRYGTSPAPTMTAGGLGRFVPQYLLGNDNYDASFSLETARGVFLGECGMGISETIGVGKPDKVTAFDLWLFDKPNVHTVTQILMSDFAFQDQTLRTKLATKGEAVLAEKGKTLHLETRSLSIDAHIVELIYAANPSLPPNSHFQKLVVEIVPTQKAGAAVR